jgi:hypothetical protein
VVEERLVDQMTQNNAQPGQASGAVRVDAHFRALLPQVEPLTPYAVRLRYDDSFWPRPGRWPRKRVPQPLLSASL